MHFDLHCFQQLYNSLVFEVLVKAFFRSWVTFSNFSVTASLLLTLVRNNFVSRIRIINCHNSKKGCENNYLQKTGMLLKNIYFLLYKKLTKILINSIVFYIFTIVCCIYVMVYSSRLLVPAQYQLLSNYAMALH